MINNQNFIYNDFDTNKDYPIFIIYTITKENSLINNEVNSNNSEIFSFNCSKCGKSFKNFFLLKRHFIEVEYNKKEKCNFCKQYFKRVKEHQIHCSAKNSNFNQIMTNIDSNINRSSTIIGSNDGFDIGIITKQFIAEFINQNEYKKLNENYIYFPNFILGEGTYGRVVFGLKIDTNLPVSIKVQKYAHSSNDLKIEAEVLLKISAKINFPQLFYYEINRAGNLLIESLLGPDLSKLFKFCDFEFDLKTICNIGIDIITFLENLHDIGYIYLDLKPNNIVFKLDNIKDGKDNISCILIDYGFCYEMKNNNKKMKTAKKNSIAGGNACFSSINILNNGNPNRKDDLESLIYVLIYFYKGFLPWSDYDKNDKIIYKKLIKEKKMEFHVIDFVGDNFKEINEIFNDIKNLGVDERPNYSKYKEILFNTSEKSIGSNNIKYKFKWQEKFSLIIRDLYINNNIGLINDTIQDIFSGYPQQLAFGYINQYYK